MPAHSLSNARTPQPYALKAYKTSKGLSPALPELLCSTRNGSRRHFKRNPPRGGFFLLCRSFSNWAARLPRLPESSQKGLLLAIFGRKTFFIISFFSQRLSWCSDVSFVYLAAIVKISSNLLIRRLLHHPEGLQHIGTTKIQKNRRIFVVRYSQIHNNRRPSFYREISCKGCNFCAPAALQPFWPAKEVSLKFSDPKFQADWPPDAWFASYSDLKFLRQNLAKNFEGGLGLQISFNLPSNFKPLLFLHIEAVWLSAKIYGTVNVYFLGFLVGHFWYTYTTGIFLLQKLSYYTKKEFRLTNYNCATVYVYVLGFLL